MMPVVILIPWCADACVVVVFSQIRKAEVQSHLLRMGACFWSYKTWTVTPGLLEKLASAVW